MRARRGRFALSAPMAASMAALVAALLCALAWALAAWPRVEFIAAASPRAWAATPANIARGAYLARAGNCAGCHTARGGAAYAGGNAIDTPFGRLYGPNLTPDSTIGIGAWRADDFWNALHNGVARDGRLLYPVFPYTHYTKLARGDADALFAFLRSLSPVRQPNRAHALRFPYDSQAALAVWRLLYFRPGVHADDARRPAAWNRGAYLVEGLGHCSACHSPRNALGAIAPGLSGGLMPVGGWYAPSLASRAEAGMQAWDTADIVQLLGSGVAPRAAMFGPMADVVRQSLQHLSASDLEAMALYLKSLPATVDTRAASAPPSEPILQRGAGLYEHRCADCHGADGRGRSVYPPLAGNRTLRLPDPVNAIRIVLHGGFAPATAGNPRPYGMPPSSPFLDDEEVAAVVSYVRASWGNTAGGVTAAQVNRHRAVPLD